jgi:hypothetical protein
MSETSELKLSVPTTLTLPDGKIIKLKAISTARLRAGETKVRKQLEAEGVNLNPPTYVPDIPNTAPGVVIEPVVYTDTTILDAPDDAKTAYKEYKKNLDRVTQLTIGLMFSTLILRGTEYEVPNDGWEAREIEDGLEVPENQDEKYVHYMLNEVLVPPSFAEACAYAVMRLSLDGIDPEVIEAFEASFRYPVQNPNGVKPQGDQE